jgi:hypothetical protein
MPFFLHSLVLRDLFSKVWQHMVVADEGLKWTTATACASSRRGGL